MGLRGGRFHRYRLGLETPIFLCRGCGLLFPDPFPQPVDALELYGDPEKYFELHDESAKVAGWVSLIADFQSRLGQSRVTLLDVGCGRGETLTAAAQTPEVRAVGLELSSAMAQAARDRGHTVLLETIEKHAASGAGPYDVVVLAAVIEHVGDPDDMLAAAATLTRPGGLLWLDTPVDPNFLTTVHRVFNRLRGSEGVINLSPTFSPYHVYGFTPRSIGVLLSRHGFVVERLLRLATIPAPVSRAWSDRLLAWGFNQATKVANRFNRGTNMSVWARRT
jgi:cyclopropane fatty-acyl-phospholipid synthase-like methyltransferase